MTPSWSRVRPARGDPDAYDLPGTTCIRVTEKIAHGILGERRLAAGDLVNTGLSASLNGYFADTGASL